MTSMECAYGSNYGRAVNGLGFFGISRAAAAGAAAGRAKSSTTGGSFLGTVGGFFDQLANTQAAKILTEGAARTALVYGDSWMKKQLGLQPPAQAVARAAAPAPPAAARPAPQIIVQAPAQPQAVRPASGFNVDTKTLAIGAAVVGALLLVGRR